ncbi:hypothetical protein GCM10023210_17930 [Chryseobacterium ginsengisoli]|uniref:Uncharacterized protein n=1 Tax=Chryseobacterium ginsengisoli TaxID=363853 RepID=A0ABP9M7J6_9FLAO
MKTRMSEKFKERSSLATRGRFFLFFISVISWCEPLNATVPDNISTEKIVEADSLKLFNDVQEDNVVKIYVTDDAQFTNLDNSITTPIVIVKIDTKKEISKKKEKERVKSNAESKKSTKKSVQKSPSVPQFYFTNPHDKEFAHFDVGLDKAVVTTTQQLKLFSINKFFVLNLMLFVSIYLVCFFKENTFFISLIGKNFQRPPPYFSIQLF